MQRSDFPAAICLPCFFNLSGILVLPNKSNGDLTGCHGDTMCNANRPSTPGLPTSLAMTQSGMLPSSMNKPGQDPTVTRISELNTIQGGTASPYLSSSLPFCVRFNLRLHSEATRLVSQGRSFLACIDAHDGQAWCGLELLDGRWVHQNEATAPGGVLTTGMTHTLVFSVRDRGVTITADEKPVVRWRGDFNRLSTNTGVLGDNDELSVLTYSSFAISRIEITPVSFEQPLTEEP